MNYTQQVWAELANAPTLVPVWHRGETWLKGTPFGVLLPNGVTFGKSVFDPDSALVSVLFALRNGAMTRRTILQKVFGFQFNCSLREGYAWWSDYWGRSHDVVHRGWRAAWFAGIKKAGFVTVDKKHRYHLTGLGARVLRYHGLY